MTTPDHVAAADEPILTKGDPRAGKFASEVAAEAEGKIKPLTVELASVDAVVFPDPAGPKSRIVYIAGDWPADLPGSPVPWAGGFVVMLPADFEIPAEVKGLLSDALPEGAQPLEIRETLNDGTEICHRIFAPAV